MLDNFQKVLIDLLYYSIYLKITQHVAAGLSFSIFLKTVIELKIYILRQKIFFSLNNIIFNEFLIISHTKIF